MDLEQQESEYYDVNEGSESELSFSQSDSNSEAKDKYQSDKFEDEATAAIPPAPEFKPKSSNPKSDLSDELSDSDDPKPSSKKPDSQIEASKEIVANNDYLDGKISYPNTNQGAGM